VRRDPIVGRWAGEQTVQVHDADHVVTAVVTAADGDGRRMGRSVWGTPL